MSLVPSSSAIETGGYTLSRSLRFRSSASAYLNRTFGSTGNQQTWTWSGWVKEAALVKLVFLQQYTDGNNQSQVAIGNSSAIRFYDLVSGSFVCDVTWSMVFRDPSAWYHIVIAVDTTQATNTNRIKLYVNGTQQTNTSSASWPSQNANLRFNANTPHFIGQNGAGNDYWDGYLTELNFIGGQALTPSSFGQTDATTGVWVPKKYTGTYGTNGFYLPFTNTTSATTLCYDSSGNGNNWTPNNISTTAGVTYDSMTDVPTLTSATAGNYCTLNPLNYASGGITLSGANLNYTAAAISSNYPCGSTMGVSSGKWYFEVTIATVGGSYPFISILPVTNYFLGSTTSVAGYSYSCWAGNGGFSNGDVCGIAFDLDSLTFSAYKNGVLMSSPYVNTGSITSGLTWMPAISGVNGCVMNANFGQRPFSYTPPTGFKALNTYNLSDPTIKQGNLYMDATLYTGTGTTTNVINTVNFQPDFVWIKDRQTAYDHQLFDSVRGAANSLYSNTTDVENYYSTSLASFNSNGFTITNTGNNQYYLNKSGDAFVSWNWKAGGTAVTNNVGSVTSQVSVNTTAGFSIVSWTGTGASNKNVGHGLNVKPQFAIVKKRNKVENWYVATSAYVVDNWAYHLFLNTSGAIDGNNDPYVLAYPTSTVIVLDNGTSNNGGNESGINYIAYVWAEVLGFSKFGSYTGNGDSDGPMVYLGFRPRYILAKPTDSSNGWFVWDAARDTYNVATKTLSPNSADTEQSAWYNNIDILSNGFKVRSYGYMNGGGVSYIYAAFAENPFKYANAR